MARAVFVNPLSFDSGSSGSDDSFYYPAAFVGNSRNCEDFEFLCIDIQIYSCIDRFVKHLMYLVFDSHLAVDDKLNYFEILTSICRYI